MNDYPVLTLKAGRGKSLLRRHPWIYSGAVKNKPENLAPGSDVTIEDDEGNFLAYAMYSPASMIIARAVSFRRDEPPEDELFIRRIENAYQLRKEIFGGTLPEAYRLVNAEADSLPGLVVDLYGDCAVCQIGAAGMERRKEKIANALLKFAKSVYERSDTDSRVKEGLEARKGMLAGVEIPERIVFSENGIRYSCDIREGHKTGFYLDQRMNRKAVMDAAKGKKDVLNCFCYTGGFGLAAVKGGAEHVLNLDSSAPALAEAKVNARLNGFSDAQFETLETDVFQYLRKCRDRAQSFDMIILDPPKFAETLSQVPKAARGYKDINLLAMKLLRPGGMLFTFSCSGAMEDDLFHKVVDSAAADAKIDLRITQWLSQGPDHPVSSSCPESRYLKGLAGFRER